MYLISILFFAAAYAIKGGWLGMIPGVKKLRERNWFFDRLLDGKVASTIAVFFFFVIALWIQLGKFVDLGMPILNILLYTPAALSLAWLVGVSPSMGEEAGAVGRIGHAWGDYIEKGFGRSYGVKKALQRGVFLGAPFAIITGDPIFLILGALFPVMHFVGQQIYYMIHRVDSWKYAEPLIGAVCIGIGVGSYLS